MLGNINLIKHAVDKEEKLYERIVEAESAALYATELTQQLLTFSKGGEPVKETFSLRTLVEESVRFALHGSNVLADSFVAEDLSPVEADEGQISQVLNNLVINANQAMPDGGALRVRASNVTVGAKDNLPLNVGRYVLLTVADEGVGIPAETLTKIFDPYFTTKDEGSGLGLASVYSIIKKHDGHIAVESKPGMGTTFKVYLPASAGKLAREGEGGWGRAFSESMTYGTGRILVMDDEEIVRDVLDESLKTLGYVVVVTKEGGEAVDAYKKAMDSGEPFDAVIMDLTIQGAWAAKKRLRAFLSLTRRSDNVGLQGARIFRRHRKAVYGLETE